METTIMGITGIISSALYLCMINIAQLSLSRESIQ